MSKRDAITSCGAAVVNTVQGKRKSPHHQARRRYHSGPREGWSASTTADLLCGSLDEEWDLDAFDFTLVLIDDAPRSDEIMLRIGYSASPRVNAQSKGRIRRKSMLGSLHTTAANRRRWRGA